METVVKMLLQSALFMSVSYGISKRKTRPTHHLATFRCLYCYCITSISNVMNSTAFQQMSLDAAKGIVLVSTPPVVSLHCSSGSPLLIGLIVCDTHKRHSLRIWAVI